MRTDQSAGLQLFHDAILCWSGLFKLERPAGGRGGDGGDWTGWTGPAGAVRTGVSIAQNRLRTALLARFLVSRLSVLTAAELARPDNPHDIPSIYPLVNMHCSPPSSSPVPNPKANTPHILRTFPSFSRPLPPSSSFQQTSCAYVAVS
jgi:hypothetical protein